MEVEKTMKIERGFGFKYTAKNISFHSNYEISIKCQQL